MYTLAVDIGGTFTDVVAFDEVARPHGVGKALTTPGDLRHGVIEGLEDAAAELRSAAAQTLLGGAKRFVHATTQSSNAVFAFTGAKTAVITTRGFGDTLTIMRATGRVAGLSVFERHHYRTTAKPRLLVDERDIFEVPSGSITQAAPSCRSTRTRSRELAQIADGARLRGGRGRVPVLAQERGARAARAREILREAAARLYVSLSSDVAPVLGRVRAQRDGAVQRLCRAGDRRLPRPPRAHARRTTGCNAPLLIVQANGGLATAAQTVPIFTVESGPAAGVVGSAQIARATRHPAT